MNEKNKQIIAYFVKNHARPGITCLMKLAYLVDYLRVKNGKEKISDFQYIRYNFGPFNPSIYKYVESLERDGIIIGKSDIFGQYTESVFYEFNEDKKLVTDKISSEELEFIDGILTGVRGFGARMLSEMAYKTDPMVKLGATMGGNEGINQVLEF